MKTEYIVGFGIGFIIGMLMTLGAVVLVSNVIMTDYDFDGEDDTIYHWETYSKCFCWSSCNSTFRCSLDGLCTPKPNCFS